MKEGTTKDRRSTGSADGTLPVEAALTTLQPLRDLAKNWDIDIASCLEEYLQDVLNSLTPEEQSKLPKDAAGFAAKTSLNFSQAALVLQNSSNVYGRKVEYLYNLVYKALEELSNKTSQNQKRSSTTTSDDISQFDAFDPHLDFLLLDDMIPTSEKINLQESKRDGLATTGNNNDSNMSTTSRSLSLGVTSMGNGSVCTHASDAVSQQQLALLLATDSKAAASATFRLLDGQCDMAEGGVLLMPGTVLPDIENNEKTKARRQSSIETVEKHVGFANEDDDHALVGGDMDVDMDGDANMDMDMDCDMGDDHQEGGGFTLANGNHDMNIDDNIDENNSNKNHHDLLPSDGVPLPLEHSPTQNRDIPLGDEFIASQQQRQQNRHEHTNPKQVDFALKPAAEKVEKKHDPWELLDPHVPTSKSQPLKIGKTYKLPQGIIHLPSQCVTGARTKDGRSRRRKQRRTSVRLQPTTLASITFQMTLATAQKQRSSHGSLNNSIFSKDSVMRSHLSHSMNSMTEDVVVPDRPKIPLKGLLFGAEFKYIAQATAKRKAADRRLSQQQQHQNQQEQPESNNNAVDEQNNNNNYDGDDDDEMYNMNFDYGGGDDYSVGDDHADMGDGDGHGDGHGDGDGLVGNTGIASLDDAYAMKDADHNDNVIPDAQTFEELCRAHIRAFAKGAAAYAAETNLSRRVGTWHEKLLPILNEEEDRPEFDIHKYSQRVIDNIEKEYERLEDLSVSSKEDINKKTQKKNRQDSIAGGPVDFNAVTLDCPHYDVCRLFLASLSMCNSGNVELKHAKRNKTDEDVLALGIKLLDNVINRPTETYNNDEQVGTQH